MKKAIALFFVILLLAGGLFYLRREDQQDKARMRELYSTVEPLQRQREALAAERDGLALDYALQMRDVGTVEILFRELDQRIFTDIYPLMRDRGITGVLGVCVQQYPENPGKMTLEQYQRLQMDGWGTCYIYETPLDPELWFEQMNLLFERDALIPPTAMYFPDNNYDSSMDDMLIRHGIKTVIHNAEDGHSATVTELGGALWHTSAMPWNYTGVNSDTALLARTNGANLAFTVGFQNLWDAYEREAFIKVLDNFASMLPVDKTLQEAVEPTPVPQDPSLAATPEEELQKPLLKVLSFEQALHDHEEAEFNNALLAKEQADREADLKAQIEALDIQIRDLYDHWGASAKQTKMPDGN